jgi:hypothetical protein
MSKRYRLSDICKAIRDDESLLDRHRKDTARDVIADIDAVPSESFSVRVTSITITLAAAFGVYPPPLEKEAVGVLGAKAIELAKHYKIEMVEARP